MPRAWWYASRAPFEPRRAVVVRLLLEHAARPQARVRRALESDLSAGRAARVRGRLMAEGPAPEATPAVVRRLARVADSRSLPDRPG